MEHCDKFYWWLEDKGVGNHRGKIVKSIATKAHTMFTGELGSSFQGVAADRLCLLKAKELQRWSSFWFKFHVCSGILLQT